MKLKMPLDILTYIKGQLSHNATRKYYKGDMLIIAHFPAQRKGKNTMNELRLAGYVCKDVIFRQTPLGREIADILLAVERQSGKYDYIPCICWGKVANMAKELDVGAFVKVSGRIESRIYEKESEKRLAIEMSVNQLDVVTA